MAYENELDKEGQVILNFNGVTLRSTEVNLKLKSLGFHLLVNKSQTTSKTKI